MREIDRSRTDVKVYTWPDVKAAFEPISFPGGQITIEADRVCITHDEKPGQDIINKLKSKGFHWSRNYGSWSRKHTANAIYAAKEIVGL